MNRLITMALLSLCLTGGVAMADRHGGGRHEVRQDRHDVRQDRRDNRDVRHDIRDVRREIRNDRREIRNDRRDIRNDRRDFRRDRWDMRRDNRRVTHTRPVLRGGSWYFDGGVRHTYRAPMVRYRYRNYAQRPMILVENYDTVPGYYWVAGSWGWNGGEWLWVSGHYEIDANYGY